LAPTVGLGRLGDGRVDCSLTLAEQFLARDNVVETLPKVD
jgi:hypothetical protein